MTAAVKPTVTRKGSEHTRTAQSGGAVRISGVSPQHTPATKIWFGKVSNEPGFRSLPHHHGEAETGGYVFKGKGRIYWGENYSEFIDMTEGDFVFVSAHMPHVEVNMSTTEELVWLTCRTPDNIVINLPDVEDWCFKAIGVSSLRAAALKKGRGEIILSAKTTRVLQKTLALLVRRAINYGCDLVSHKASYGIVAASLRPSSNGCMRSPRTCNTRVGTFT